MVLMLKYGVGSKVVKKKKKKKKEGWDGMVWFKKEWIDYVSWKKKKKGNGMEFFSDELLK